MDSKKIKISLVDDHKMFREGLKFVLSGMDNTEVISESSSGAEFLDNLDSTHPDLVLMDISMPDINGIEATRQAVNRYPGIKIIALSMFGDEEYYSKMIQAGAKGFIIKESGSEELEKAIQEVSGGGTYFSQKLLQNIILNFSSTEPTEKSRDVISSPSGKGRCSS
ncbi:MAG: response regulator transcription factor [Bacteroidales bacterium]